MKINIKFNYRSIAPDEAWWRETAAANEGERVCWVGYRNNESSSSSIIEEIIKKKTRTIQSKGVDHLTQLPAEIRRSAQRQSQRQEWENSKGPWERKALHYKENNDRDECNKKSELIRSRERTALH